MKAAVLPCRKIPGIPKRIPKSGAEQYLFNLLQYADRRSCSWVLLGSERGVNKDLPTFPAAG
jgi:hypothetical protein